MRRLIVSVMSAALLIGGATASFAADEKEGKIQKRKENQQKRIAKGAANGSLTPGETARLEKKEQKINKEVRAERQANGGKLTGKERARVNRQQDKLSKDIYKEKHDGETQK